MSIDIPAERVLAGLDVGLSATTHTRTPVFTQGSLRSCSSLASFSLCSRWWPWRSSFGRETPSKSGRGENDVFLHRPDCSQHRSCVCHTLNHESAADRLPWHQLPMYSSASASPPAAAGPKSFKPNRNEGSFLRFWKSPDSGFNHLSTTPCAPPSFSQVPVLVRPECALLHGGVGGSPRSPATADTISCRRQHPRRVYGNYFQSI